MPIQAEFSERQYELAVGTELAARGGQFSVPTQAAEHQLGYDIALVPGVSSVWWMLGLRDGPPGVPPGRGTLGHRDAPIFAASLFLQYKRPERVRAGNAREAMPRKSARIKPHVPYLRYELEAQQLARLIDLSREVGPLAEVCYAAANFVSLSQLTECQATRSVILGSNFLSVAVVDAALNNPPDPDDAGAHVWTYNSRFGNRTGLLCSDPTAINGYQGNEIFEALTARLAESSRGLDDHLYALDEGVRAWNRRVSGRSENQPDEWHGAIQMPGAFEAAISIDTWTRRQGLGWYVAVQFRGTPGS